MNNKTIILGSVDMEWNFARGRFYCKCENAEPMNPFDMVICGILHRSNGNMLKSDLATIIGFNITDNTVNNRYCDRSEKAIFDNAVNSLVNYGLITADDYELSLTEAGANAFMTRTKSSSESKYVDLWADEFLKENFQYDLLSSITFDSVEYTDTPSWNVLASSPMKALVVQKSELSQSSKISEIVLSGMEYYRANLKCKVCYNIENKRTYVCSYSETQDIDEKVLNNASLQERLLSKFFDRESLSVFLKPVYQNDKEKSILSQECNEVDGVNEILCKSEFKEKLRDSLCDNKFTILYFPIKEIDDYLNEYLRNLSGIVCVDYVSGEFEDYPVGQDVIIEDNVCYHHVNNIRTTDICVSNDSYYSFLPYIVNFNGADYSIQMIYKFKDEKYKLSVLYAPFVNYILDSILKIDKKELEGLNETSSPDIVNKVSDSFSFVRKLELGADNQEKKNQIREFTLQTVIKWKKILHDRLDDLEEYINDGQEDEESRRVLDKIENDIKAVHCVEDSDKELIEHVTQVKQRLYNVSIPNVPKVKLKPVYILDTSIFMDMSNVLNRFDLQYDKIVIPRAMEQELDGLTHDKDKGGKARAARLQIRRNPQAVLIKDDVDRSLLPVGFDPNKKDNDMLAVAIELSKDDDISKVVIVSNDSEFLHNVRDCVDNGIISANIEGIDLDELLLRLEN